MEPVLEDLPRVQPMCLVRMKPLGAAGAGDLGLYMDSQNYGGAIVTGIVRIFCAKPKRAISTRAVKNNLEANPRFREAGATHELSPVFNNLDPVLASHKHYGKKLTAYRTGNVPPPPPPGSVIVHYSPDHLTAMVRCYKLENGEPCTEPRTRKIALGLMGPSEVLKPEHRDRVKAQVLMAYGLRFSNTWLSCKTTFAHGTEDPRNWMVNRNGTTRLRSLGLTHESRLGRRVCLVEVKVRVPEGQTSGSAAQGPSDTLFRAAANHALWALADLASEIGVPADDARRIVPVTEAGRETWACFRAAPLKDTGLTWGGPLDFGETGGVVDGVPVPIRAPASNLSLMAKIDSLKSARTRGVPEPSFRRDADTVQQAVSVYQDLGGCLGPSFGTYSPPSMRALAATVYSNLFCGPPRKPGPDAAPLSRGARLCGRRPAAAPPRLRPLETKLTLLRSCVNPEILSDDDLNAEINAEKARLRVISVLYPRLSDHLALRTWFPAAPQRLHREPGMPGALWTSRTAGSRSAHVGRPVSSLALRAYLQLFVLRGIRFVTPETQQVLDLQKHCHYLLDAGQRAGQLVGPCTMPGRVGRADESLSAYVKLWKNKYADLECQTRLEPMMNGLIPVLNRFPDEKDAMSTQVLAPRAPKIGYGTPPLSHIRQGLAFNGRIPRTALEEDLTARWRSR